MAGRPEDVSDTEILRSIDGLEHPVVSTSEVAESLSIGSEGTLKRLKDLRNRGLVGGRKVGNPFIWWLTEEGEAYMAGEMKDLSEDET